MPPINPEPQHYSIPVISETEPRRMPTAVADAAHIDVVMSNLSLDSLPQSPELFDTAAFASDDTAVTLPHPNRNDLRAAAAEYAASGQKDASLAIWKENLLTPTHRHQGEYSSYIKFLRRFSYADELRELCAQSTELNLSTKTHANLTKALLRAKCYDAVPQALDSLMHLTNEHQVGFATFIITSLLAESQHTAAVRAADVALRYVAKEHTPALLELRTRARVFDLSACAYELVETRGGGDLVAYGDLIRYLPKAKRGAMQGAVMKAVEERPVNAENLVKEASLWIDLSEAGCLAPVNLRTLVSKNSEQFVKDPNGIYTAFRLNGMTLTSALAISLFDLWCDRQPETALKLPPLTASNGKEELETRCFRLAIANPQLEGALEILHTADKSPQQKLMTAEHAIGLAAHGELPAAEQVWRGLADTDLHYVHACFIALLQADVDRAQIEPLVNVILPPRGIEFVSSFDRQALRLYAAHAGNSRPHHLLQFKRTLERLSDKDLLQPEAEERIQQVFMDPQRIFRYDRPLLSEATNLGVTAMIAGNLDADGKWRLHPHDSMRSKTA